MRSVFPVSLHLVRGGPSHNQLLSPLTRYVGLCGHYGVSEIHLPWEHAELERAVARLSYAQREDGRPLAVASVEREHTLMQLGRQVGGVLAQLGGLGPELALAEARAAKNGGLIHLRLRLWGNELSAVPFEIAVAPPNLPGEGHRLALRTQAPVCLTREVLGAHAMSVAWDRPPRVLFAWAAPGSEVPHMTNLHGIERAVAQIVSGEDVREVTRKFRTLHGREPEDGEIQDLAVREATKKLLTLLPFASLEDIATACASAEYTHVYLLAHGDTLVEEGETRHGVRLHATTGSPEARVVTGAELALAFGAYRDGGQVRLMPNVVTLAICDGGRQGSVVVPGGSMAHALHERGVAWVVASQFPLSFGAADDLASVWMGELLAGTDPRWALQKLRATLARRSRSTHDWGSIVAYATQSDDFVDSTARFFRRQLEARVSALQAKAERIAKKLPVDRAKLLEVAEGVERTFQDAERAQAVPGPAVGTDPAEDELRRTGRRALRSQFLTRWARAEKRIGIAMLEAGSPGKTGKNGAAVVASTFRQEAEDMFEKALAHYRAASSDGPNEHWPLVQHIALSVWLKRGLPVDLWERAYANAVSAAAGEGAEGGWGHSSLVELHILSSHPECARSPLMLAGEALEKEIERQVRSFIARLPERDHTLDGQLSLYPLYYPKSVDLALVDRARDVIWGRSPAG